MNPVETTVDLAARMPVSQPSARGLSKLQRSVLAIAHYNRQVGMGTPSFTADVLAREVLLVAYGWPVKTCWNGTAVHPRAHFGEHYFNPAEIGQAAYRRGVVAVSRALSRLEARNLVMIVIGAVSHWTGAILTAEGIRVSATCGDVVLDPLPGCGVVERPRPLVLPRGL